MSGPSPAAAPAPMPLVWLAVIALAVALVPRGAALWHADFPLNDGGMFAVMIEELVDAGFVPPLETSYNGARVPWAYPPLPFYLAGGVHALGGADVVAILHWLPLVLNLGSVVAFCWLATGLIRSRAGQVTAAAAYAIMPLSFTWQIMGAGLTRSAGILFAILAVAAACRFLDRRHRLGVCRGNGMGPSRFPDRLLDAVLTAVFAAAAILSHPEMTVQCGTMLAVLWLLKGRSRSAVVAGLGIAAGIVALTAPWWVMVLLRYGAGPFLAASGTVEWSIAELAPLALLSFTADGYATPLAVLAMLGVFFELARYRFLLPLWLLAAFVVPHLGFRAATVPAALLAGVALGDLIVPSLLGAAAHGGRRGWLPRLTALVLPAALLGQALLLVTSSEIARARTNPFVTRGERDAMRWAAEHLAADARVLVVTSAESWAEDPASEWFPAIARRVSVVTPQACEWFASGEFSRRIRAYDALAPCRREGIACLVEWLGTHRIEISHVFVSKVPRGPVQPVRLAEDLAASSRFARVYEGPGAVVFAMR